MHIDRNIIISILALLVSLAVAAFTIWNEFYKDTILKRQELTSTLDNYFELDQQIIQLNTLPITADQKEFATFSLSNRAFMLLRYVDELYESTDKNQTLDDTFLLSVAHDRAGNFLRAKEYLLKAYKEFEESEDLLENRHNTYASIIRSLAILAKKEGNNLEATKYFKQALDLFSSPANDFEREFRIKTKNIMIQYHIMDFDYDSAASEILQLANEIFEMPCTPFRGEWLFRSYDIIQQFNTRLNYKIDMPTQNSDQPECLYDPLYKNLPAQFSHTNDQGSTMNLGDKKLQ